MWAKLQQSRTLALAAFVPEVGPFVRAIVGAVLGLVGGIVAMAGAPFEGEKELLRLREDSEDNERELLRLRSDLSDRRDQVAELESRLEEARREAAEAKSGGTRVENLQEAIDRARRIVDANVEKLSGGLGEQVVAVEQTIGSMKDMAAALKEIAQHVEALASSAEESSSSILEMTATNDEVAENMANLAANVRETVSSIGRPK